MDQLTSTPVREGEVFVVELTQFSGPLDLLLSLIRDEQIDIYDIPIARIAEQFLARIQTMAIDQQKYFHFYVDSIDRAQQNVNVLDEAMRRSAWRLRDLADSYIAGWDSKFHYDRWRPITAIRP